MGVISIHFRAFLRPRYRIRMFGGDHKISFFFVCFFFFFGGGGGGSMPDIPIFQGGGGGGNSGCMKKN